MRISDWSSDVCSSDLAVIPPTLRSVLAMHRGGNARGALVKQADSLVTEYLRQIDYDVLADADRMSEFYKLFYALENDMRDLIESAMSESKGIDWWDTWVPQAVRDNVKKNHEREASEGLPPRSDRLIDYTPFGELGHIVQENWEVFRSEEHTSEIQSLVRHSYAVICSKKQQLQNNNNK